MSKITIRLLLVLFLLPAGLHARPIEVARKVMADLFEAAGYYRFSPPEIRISPNNDRVAAYYPASNTIVIDEQAYDICTSFGRDSLNALAFVLGHELAHSFQVEIRDGKAPTNFLSYDRQFSSTIRLEKAADIQGVFNAYLAGYRVYDLVPEILEKIYDTYQLKGVILKGYPSLLERKQSAHETMEVVKDLIHLFESSNYLVMAGKYYLASNALEYMLQYYQGREVYNNLGVLYLLNALEIFDPETDEFFYPFELEWHTFLDRDALGRGRAPLPSFQLELREELLERAAFYFSESMRMDPSYRPAKINRINTLLLLKRPEEAHALFREYFSERRIARKKDQQHSLETITLGMIYYFLEKNRKRKEAVDLLGAVARERNGLSGEIAWHNLRKMEGTASAGVAVRLASYPLPKELLRISGTLRLPDMSKAQAVVLSETSGVYALFRKEGNSQCWSFRDDKGALISFSAFDPGAFNFTVEDLRKSNLPDYGNLIPTSDGFFISSPDGQLILRVSEEGRVLAAVKCYYHR